MWKEGFYKLTFIAPILPEILCVKLEKLLFTPLSKGEGYKWEMDGKTFKIVPFTNQPRDSMKAYRIYFDCDITTGMYLLDSVFGMIKGIAATGIEYTLKLEKVSHKEWFNFLHGQPQCIMTDSRGLFIKKGVGIVLMNDSLILQIRSIKNGRLNIADSLTKVDLIREELTHSIQVGLFSLSKSKNTA